MKVWSTAALEFGFDDILCKRELNQSCCIVNEEVIERNVELCSGDSYLLQYRKGLPVEAWLSMKNKFTRKWCIKTNLTPAARAAQIK